MVTLHVSPLFNVLCCSPTTKWLKFNYLVYFVNGKIIFIRDMKHDLSQCWSVNTNNKCIEFSMFQVVAAYLVWCTYLFYMQANQSVKCFIFIASLSIISWKSPKNDANTMFFFIMKNESRFQQTKCSNYRWNSEGITAWIKYLLIQTFVLDIWFIEVLKSYYDFVSGFSNCTLFL